MSESRKDSHTIRIDKDSHLMLERAGYHHPETIIKIKKNLRDESDLKRLVSIASLLTLQGLNSDNNLDLFLKYIKNDYQTKTFMCFVSNDCFDKEIYRLLLKHNVIVTPEFFFILKKFYQCSPEKIKKLLALECQFDFLNQILISLDKIGSSREFIQCLIDCGRKFSAEHVLAAIPKLMHSDYSLAKNIEIFQLILNYSKAIHKKTFFGFILLIKNDNYTIENLRAVITDTANSASIASALNLLISQDNLNATTRALIIKHSNEALTIAKLACEIKLADLSADYYKKLSQLDPRYFSPLYIVFHELNKDQCLANFIDLIFCSIDAIFQLANAIQKAAPLDEKSVEKLTTDFFRALRQKAFVSVTLEKNATENNLFFNFFCKKDESRQSKSNEQGRIDVVKHICKFL